MFKTAVWRSARHADGVPGVLVRDSLCRPLLGDTGALSVISGGGSTTIKPATIRPGSRMKLNDSSE